jgi:hypothetical protein
MPLASPLDDSRSGSTSGRHRAFLTFVAIGSAVVLLSTARSQIADTNFVVLWEAVSVLEGDRALIDLFEWGAPLAVLLSAAAQWLVGYRLIGEMALQWTFTIAGVTLAYHLAARLTRTYAAALLTLPLALILLANTPSYHYSKLFFFPFGLWLAWHYLEHPSLRRAAALGATTAAAFLVRHDYLLYLGFVSALALVLAPFTAGTWAPRRWLRDVGIAAVTAAACVAPWAAFVEMREGFVAYTRLRVAKNEPAGPAFTSLLAIDPVRVFDASFGTPAEPGEIGFIWNPNVSAAQRIAIESRLHLRPLDGRDGQGRLRYSVPDLGNRDLLTLDPYILDGIGIPWDRLKTLPLPSLPERTAALDWLHQMSLGLSLALIGATTLAGARWRPGRPLPIDTAQTLAAGSLLTLCATLLFRQPSYVVVTAPLAAAMTAVFLHRGPSHSSALGRRLSRLGRGAALVLLALTTFAALGWARPALLVHPRTVPHDVTSALADLFSSPPVGSDPRFAYLRDCTRPGDHILVTGSTPFHVPYYARRPVAGGHLYWHSAWANDAAHEAQSLQLIERQSVPIVFSTHDPVLDDFAAYPAIRDYLLANYQEAPGSDGRVLTERRRAPQGTYGPGGWPCFGPGSPGR